MNSLNWQSGGHSQTSLRIHIEGFFTSGFDTELILAYGHSQTEAILFSVVSIDTIVDSLSLMEGSSDIASKGQLKDSRSDGATARWFLSQRRAPDEELALICSHW